MIEFAANNEAGITFFIDKFSKDTLPWHIDMLCATDSDKVYGVFRIPNMVWIKAVGFDDDTLFYMEDFLIRNASIIERMCWHPEDFETLKLDGGVDP